MNADCRRSAAEGRAVGSLRTEYRVLFTFIHLTQYQTKIFTSGSRTAGNPCLQEMHLQAISASQDKTMTSRYTLTEGTRAGGARNACVHKGSAMHAHNEQTALAHSC